MNGFWRGLYTFLRENEIEVKLNSFLFSRITFEKNNGESVINTDTTFPYRHLFTLTL